MNHNKHELTIRANGFNDGVRAAINVIERIRRESPLRIEFNLGEVQKDIEQQFQSVEPIPIHMKEWGPLKLENKDIIPWVLITEENEYEFGFKDKEKRGMYDAPLPSPKVTVYGAKIKGTFFYKYVGDVGISYAFDASKAKYVFKTTELSSLSTEFYRMGKIIDKLSGIYNKEERESMIASMEHMLITNNAFFIYHFIKDMP